MEKVKNGYDYIIRGGEVMFCSNCGTEIKDGEKFCPSCGAPTAASEKIKAAAGEVINSAEKELSSAIDEVEASISNAGSRNNAGAKAANSGSNVNAEADSSNTCRTGAADANNGNAASGAGSANTANAYSTVSDNFSGSNSSNMSGETKIRLKDDRGIVSYVLLNIITCGIYGFYFIHKMAQEVNIACDGDGEETPGLLIFILLSIVTCGFYAYYWYYKLGNRLSANASRYGLTFQENGTTVLLWCIVGLVLCGIGPLIGMYLLIKNSNMICSAYNRQNGLQ